MSSSPARPIASIHAIGAAQLVAWGAAFYAIPPLLPRISADLGVSTSALSIAMTVGLVLNAIGSLVVGRWIQRRGARTPMVAGSIVASGALLLLASSNSASLVLFGLALLGATYAALLYEPAFAAVSAMTPNLVARTHAIQVVTFWGGWAALWALPAASLLGGWFGWRAALVVLATLLAGYTIYVHAHLPALRERPAPRAGVMPRVEVSLAIAFVLGSFVTTALVFNGLLLLAERDVSIERASIVIALLAPSQVIGRLWFMRRRGRLARYDGMLPFLLVAAGSAALLAAPRLCALVLFVVLFGGGAGLMTTVRAAVVVARVPAGQAATLLAAYSFITSIARALAPAASSCIQATFGFEVALLALATMALLAAALVSGASARHRAG